MCVIIFVPAGEKITKSELQKAWDTNPHGAGYAVQIEQENIPVVKYSRGFMKFESYYKAIKQYIGKNNLLIHMRISTSNKVNQLQTHPYNIYNVESLYGFTRYPVACMNGTISDQELHNGFNDTMSYIADYVKAFKVVNQNVVDIIEQATGSKWAVMLPEKVFLSSEFIEDNGLYYSNQNHLHRRIWYCDVYDYKENGSSTKTPTVKDTIGRKLFKQVIKDKNLYTEVKSYIEAWKDYPFMIHELELCNTVAEIYSLVYSYY